MKPLFVSELRKIVDGTLIKGNDDLLIIDATYYLETMKSQNSLLFLRRQWKINWSVIQKYVPCVVIVDQCFDKLNSIEGCTIIKVEDLETAYWKFVEWYRNLFQIPVIAVTGTSGKTTTKDMIKHILKHSNKIQGTDFSANGRTGHLLYLLRIDDSTEAAVFETAVGKPGDLIYSCRHFKPTIGIITNIGIDHLDECKTVDGYIQAKAEMLTVLGDEGTLIINTDDENSKKIGVKNFSGQTIYFGIHNSCHFQATNIRFEKSGMDFILMFNNMKYPIFVPGYGEHQVYNALAALAAVHELGIGIKEAAEQLQTFENLPNHLQLVNGINGCLILDDTWNINPTSLRAGIETLNVIADGRKKIALLGQINALGENTFEIANQVGEMIAEIGVDILITVGLTANTIAERACEKGLPGEAYPFPDTNGIFELLKNLLDQNTIILAKCSMFDSAFKNLLESLKH